MVFDIHFFLLIIFKCKEEEEITNCQFLPIFIYYFDLATNHCRYSENRKFILKNMQSVDLGSSKTFTNAGETGYLKRKLNFH